MLKVFVYLILAISLTNASPVRNRFSEDFDDFSRETMPAKESSDVVDFYDAYLRRREPSESRLEDYLLSQPKPMEDETYSREIPDDDEDSYWGESRNDDSYDFAQRKGFYDDEDAANNKFEEANYRGYTNDADVEESLYDEEELPDEGEGRSDMNEEAFEDDLEEDNEDANQEFNDDYEDVDPKEASDEDEQEEEEEEEEKEEEEDEPEMDINYATEDEAKMDSNEEDDIITSEDFEDSNDEAKEKYTGDFLDESEEAEEGYNDEPEEETEEEPEKTAEDSEDESEDETEDESEEKYQDETDEEPEEAFDEIEYPEDDPEPLKAKLSDEIQGIRDQDDDWKDSEDEVQEFDESEMVNKEDITREEAKSDASLKQRDERYQPAKRLHESLARLRNLPSEKNLKNDREKIEKELDYFKKNTLANKANVEDSYVFAK